MGADEILGGVLDWARMYRYNVRSNNILRAVTGARYGSVVEK